MANSTVMLFTSRPVCSQPCRGAGRRRTLARAATRLQEGSGLVFKVESRDTLHVPINRVPADPELSVARYLANSPDQFTQIPLPLGTRLRKVTEAPGLYEMDIPQFKFFDVTIQPRLLVSIIASPGRLMMKAQRAQLLGTFAAHSDQFDFGLRVDLHKAPNGRGLESQIHLRILADPPPPLNVIPKTVLETTGNAGIQTVLVGMHRRLIENVARDYTHWATDADFREKREANLVQLTAVPMVN